MNLKTHSLFDTNKSCNLALSWMSTTKYKYIFQSGPSNRKRGDIYVHSWTYIYRIFISASCWTHMKSTFLEFLASGWLIIFFYAFMKYQIHGSNDQLSGPQNNEQPLQWRHNGRDGVSNHQPCHCLFNRLFRRRSKKYSKLRVTGLCAGNSPVTGELPAQMASNAENASIWWRHHVLRFSMSSY